MTYKVRQFTVLSSRLSSRRRDVMYYYIAASQAALLNIYEGDRDRVRDLPAIPRKNNESCFLTLGILHVTACFDREKPCNVTTAISANLNESGRTGDNAKKRGYTIWKFFKRKVPRAFFVPPSPLQGLIV